MKARKYVCVQYDKHTQQRLREWATRMGFDLATKFNGDQQPIDEFDFHTTVFYSMNPVDPLPDEPGYQLTSSHLVTPVKFELLGMEKNVPVLKLQAKGMIQTLRTRYEQHGLVDQWDSYIPHISLSYSKEIPDVSTMALPTFPISFDSVQIKDIEEKPQ